MHTVEKGGTGNKMVEADRLSLPRRVGRMMCSSLELKQMQMQAQLLKTLPCRITLALGNDGDLR